ncbi:hypothetical protein [Chitinophaga vietnamensis]|uniref:hypothetical protein n=1 Tax=Chitinophaga vietnamensis TaxID=2593957 RepID=UPI001178602D|nr:hypothetical protein [Chitinophaga vietnamensis]
MTLYEFYFDNKLVCILRKGDLSVIPAIGDRIQLKLRSAYASRYGNDSWWLVFERSLLLELDENNHLANETIRFNLARDFHNKDWGDWALAQQLG